MHVSVIRCAVIYPMTLGITNRNYWLLRLRKTDVGKFRRSPIVMQRFISDSPGCHDMDVFPLSDAISLSPKIVVIAKGHFPVDSLDFSGFNSAVSNPITPIPDFGLCMVRAADLPDRAITAHK